MTTTTFTATAAVADAVGAPLDVRDVTLSLPLAHEVLIKVEASGVCRSDLTVSSADHGFPLPMILGHEIAGTVERVGSSVISVRPGDTVVACGVSQCGQCTNCRLGEPYRCRNRSIASRGPGDDPRVLDGTTRVGQFMNIGGLASHTVVHENLVVPVPAEVPPEAACLLGCGVATGLGAALNSAKVARGDTVVVLGCGGVGLNIVQGARMGGARRVIAVDMNPEALELATVMGATDTLNAAETDVPEGVREITGGVGASHAFEAIGLATTVRQGMDALAVGGTLYLVGVQSPGSSLEIPFSHFFQQKSVRGIAMGSTVPHVHIPEYADLYLQGRLQLDPIVANRIRLDQVNDAFDRLRNGVAARSIVTAA